MSLLCTFYLKNVIVWDLKDFLKRCKYIEPITQDQMKEF